MRLASLIDPRCPREGECGRLPRGETMGRISWERLAALAGLAFVVLYVAAFALGIEVGASDREILDYYASSGHRAKEVRRLLPHRGRSSCLGRLHDGAPLPDREGRARDIDAR